MMTVIITNYNDSGNDNNNGNDNSDDNNRQLLQNQ